ncbi:hypothetical protein O181_111325 [Austropuccinia psidii MF-1]|uniref:Uncharacterized protein n=1 Tax=Austropuccinia psidii MF-1 TaxID=1389203 RepID=A0A9Q3PSE6_9BASI|nr:hypothetical protein [Austropuccinia psidii MF-1]
MRPHRPPDDTPTLPPHLGPHHSLRFHTPSLTIFKLTWCPPKMPPPPLTILMLCPPNMPPTVLTILMLAVPSQHASNATLTLLQPPQDETTILPPISALTAPYASAPAGCNP